MNQLAAKASRRPAFQRLRATRRGGLYMLLCLTILPASMVLFAGFLSYLDGAVRRTNIEAHRLRAELMAESALAYYGAMKSEDNEASVGGAQGTIAGREFVSGASFEIVGGARPEDNAPIVFRGFAVAKHGVLGSIRYENEIAAVLSGAEDSAGVPQIRITGISRGITPLSD